MKKRTLLYAVVLTCIQISFAQNKSIWIAVGDNIFNKSQKNSSSTGYYLQTINDSMAIRRTGTSTNTTTTTIRNAFNCNFGISKTRSISPKILLEYGIGLNVIRFTAMTEIGYSRVQFSDQFDTIRYSTSTFNNTIDKKTTYINPFLIPQIGVNYFNLDLILPVNLKYRLSKLFEVAGGFEFSSSLFARSVAETTGREKISETKDEIIYKHILVKKVNNNTQAIPRLGASVMVQSMFRIDGKNAIALGMNYRINTILKGNVSNIFFSDTETVSDNRYWRVYLKYCRAL